jgi:hypothetical protein
VNLSLTELLRHGTQKIYHEETPEESRLGQKEPNQMVLQKSSARKTLKNSKKEKASKLKTLKNLFLGSTKKAKPKKTLLAKTTGIKKAKKEPPKTSKLPSKKTLAAHYHKNKAGVHKADVKGKGGSQNKDKSVKTAKSGVEASASLAKPGSSVKQELPAKGPKIAKSSVTSSRTKPRGSYSKLSGGHVDSGGEAVCREVACEGLATTGGYCRMHYIKNWKKIKRKEVILREHKLNQYIEELVAKYPDKYIEAIRQDLANDKDFSKVIYDLDLDESVDDFDVESENVDNLIDNIRRDFDDEGDGF